MKTMRQFVKRRFGALHAAVALMAILALLPMTASQAAAAGTATITINSFQADGSTPLPFARFQVTDSSGTDYGKLESAPPSGQAVFTVDPGNDSLTFTVTEETPPVCGVAEGPKTIKNVKDGENRVVDFATSFDPNCSLGSISVYAYACPSSVDGSSANYADYQATCTQTIDGETFNIDSSGSSGDAWSVVTGAWGIGGRAPLIGLSAGDYTIADSGDANPMVFCANYAANPADQGIVPQANQAQVRQGAVGVSVNHDRVSCDFFTVSGNGASSGGNSGNSANGNGSGNVSPAESGTASLEVHLSACPAGYTGKNYYDDCHGNGLAGHTISIDGPGSFSDSAVTAMPAAPGPGAATFDSLAAGSYFVAEDIPGDTDTYYVYCSKAENDTAVPFTYNDASGEGFDITLTKGLHVVCDFSIVPNRQFSPATITVLKYTCAARYAAAGKTYDDFKGDCPDTTNDVAFSLSVQGGGAPTTAVTGAAGAGEAVFDALSPATYLLSENVPGEFSTPRVYCSADGGAWAKKTLSSASEATFTIDGSGQQIACRWFNVPENLSGGNGSGNGGNSGGARGSLTIHKAQCPAGLTSGYYDACHDSVVPGVTFDIDGPNSASDSKATASNGEVAFRDLAAGAYTVTEIPPADPHTAVYVVLCTQDGKDFAKTYDDSTGLRINFKLPEGANVVCDWYNVPPPKATATATPAPASTSTPAPIPASTSKGSITIQKFLCQGKQNNAYNWSADCVSYGAGADFKLTATSGGATWSGTTAASGQLVFGSLANGTYSLEETNGSWCHAEAEHVDASGNLKVLNTQNTTVYIYNCSKKTVSVLPSTGTGPTPDAPASGAMMEIFGVAGLVFLMIVRKRTSRQ